MNVIDEKIILAMNKYYCLEGDNEKICAEKSLRLAQLLKRIHSENEINIVRERIVSISTKVEVEIRNFSVTFCPAYRFIIPILAEKLGPLSRIEEMFFYVSCIYPVYTGILIKTVFEDDVQLKRKLSYGSIIVERPESKRYAVFKRVLDQIPLHWGGYQYLSVYATLRKYPVRNITYCNETPLIFDALFGDGDNKLACRLEKSL